MLYAGYATGADKRYASFTVIVSKTQHTYAPSSKEVNWRTEHCCCCILRVFHMLSRVFQQLGHYTVEDLKFNCSPKLHFFRDFNMRQLIHARMAYSPCERQAGTNAPHAYHNHNLGNKMQKNKNYIIVIIISIARIYCALLVFITLRSTYVRCIFFCFLSIYG